jgi:hypothetical protein
LLISKSATPVSAVNGCALGALAALAAGVAHAARSFTRRSGLKASHDGSAAMGLLRSTGNPPGTGRETWVPESFISVTKTANLFLREAMISSSRGGHPRIDVRVLDHLLGGL